MLQNAALLHQVLVFRRNIKPKIHVGDRLFWRFLRRFYSGWRRVCFFVQPATVTKWHREDLFEIYWRWISRIRGGRRPLDAQGVLLLRRMQADNPDWEPARFQGELQLLGYIACINTIKKHLGLFPDGAGGGVRRPDGPGWWTFLKLHREYIAAMDFFVVYSLGYTPLYVFFVIDHARRRILHVNVTRFPNQDWVARQFKEAFPFEHGIRFLIHDNDPVFVSLRKFMKDILGIKAKRIMKGCPWMNGIAERFVRTIRAELTDHIIPVNELHLMRLVREYARYYNADRTHTTLALDSPDGRAPEPPPDPGSKVIALPRVRGLHHVYRRVKAA